MDVKYDNEKLGKDAEAFLSEFRSKMQKIADETLGNAYVDILPHIESDSWVNYREALRQELERDFKDSGFKSTWAVNFRRKIFVEHREELAKLIEKDLLNRVGELEDQLKIYERQRWL